MGKEHNYEAFQLIYELAINVMRKAISPDPDPDPNASDLKKP